MMMKLLKKNVHQFKRNMKIYLNGTVSGQEVLDLIDNWARRGICIWIITDSTHFFIVFGICKRSGV